jgi:hypothetical protein
MGMTIGTFGGLVLCDQIDITEVRLSKSNPVDP